MSPSPRGDEPRPGIVVVHHLPGWDEFNQEFSDRLARHGYRVICPDLYCRFGHGTPDDVTAKVRAAGRRPDDNVVADCGAALQLAEGPARQPTARSASSASCSGGRHAVLAASPGARVRRRGRPVGWGSDQAPDAAHPGPAGRTDRLHRRPRQPRCSASSATTTSHPPPEQVDHHEAELKKHGKDYEFHRYDGAGHGFFYYHTPMYRPEQAMDGWAKVFVFFGDRLAG